MRVEEELSEFEARIFAILIIPIIECVELDVLRCRLMK